MIDSVRVNPLPQQAVSQTKKKKENKEEIETADRNKLIWGSFGHVLSDLCERLKIAAYDRINEHARFFFCITLRYINRVRFHHNRRRRSRWSVHEIWRWRRAWWYWWWWWCWNRVQCGNGSVVSQAVVPTYDAKTQHVSLVVENLEALGARGRGKAGHHLNLPESADSAVAVDYVATLQKVFVRLRIVEPPHHRPHRRYRSVDDLDHGGAALFLSDVVRVVPRHRFWHRNRHRRWDAVTPLAHHRRRNRRRASVTVHNRCCGGSTGRIDPMKLNRRRHS